MESRPSFDGHYYRLEEAPFGPGPVRGHIPVVIGAIGPRMLRHVARYADQWDTWGGVDRIAENGRVVDELARSLGRDPRAIRRSICTGAEPLRSAEALRRHVARYAASGVDTFIYNVGDEPDALELVSRSAGWLEEVAEELTGQQRAGASS
jgi:alkanesulfonate monooxygenase SsuD/methylene tetrahydromethanopterin reductase-like flavin-dependent oxidoreductase (luciferase family)